MLVNLGAMATSVGFQLHLSWRAVRKSLLFRKRLGVRPPARGEYSIPVLIGLNPGITKGDLARALFLDAANVSTLVGKLQRDGLIDQRPLEGDKRKKGLFLTEAGQAFAEAASAKSADLESGVGSALTPGENAELVRLLTKLRQSL